MNQRPAIVAIYCPVWHRYPHMDAWKGEGWNEWQLLKTAPPRFKGHHQPLRPTWGCFDESDPRWAAKEIALAADHGVDVFLFDWYWYSGVQIMQEALERGFLRAPNRRRLRFALMWANHHWCDYFPPPREGPWNTWLPMRHSAADLRHVVDYCGDHYFRQPNYWRFADKLFFSIFAPEAFIEQLGGAAATRQLLRQMDRRLQRRRLPAIHWNAMTWTADHVPQLLSAGFASTTTYNVTSSGNNNTKPGASLIDRYEDVMAAHVRHWRTMATTTLLHFPVVTMGWDVTPRCRHDEPWPLRPVRGNTRTADSCQLIEERKGQLRYPYVHVVTGNTPRQFEQLCRDAADHLGAMPSREKFLLVNAWNEWTEGSYLLAEKQHGTAYLQALRNVFGRRTEST
jgi:hypothetical protein